MSDTDTPSVHDAVVRVFVTYQQPDQEYPWQRGRTDSTSGSGVVVGNGLVLTGAHVVAHATFIQIRRYRGARKYLATVRGICHDADLALLHVEDSAFMAGVPEIEFGNLPDFQDRVAVIGFPIGGEEMSVTEGVVSRIEVQEYTHSQRALLAVTVDAPINSGNSGGPVFDEEGRVVGIAFQAYDDAENIGELVPTPILRRFLTAIEGNLPLDVPGLGLAWDNLENPVLRRQVGIDERSGTGVRISVIDHGGSADGTLQPDDALLAIDGYEIADDGTIVYRDRIRTAFDVVLGDHFVGDRVPVRLLRDGKLRDLQLTLAPFRPLIPPAQFDTSARWFVAAGLVFQVLRRDYLAIWERWWETAPKPLVALYRTGSRTPERTEVIIITAVLADELNVGYGHHVYDTVMTTNGRTPRDLDDFVSMVDNGDGLIDIRTGRHGRITLDAKTRSQWPSILERYSVPRDRR